MATRSSWYSLPSLPAPVRCALAALLLLLATFPARGAALQTFSTGSLVIHAGGHSHPFTVELATTEAQRAQGLMFRQTLASDHGMLFLYPRARVINMWMKNTFVPLDMLFLDSEGGVVALHERAVPQSLSVISSGVRARAVIEVPGGTVQRLAIRIGDRVDTPLLPKQ